MERQEIIDEARKWIGTRWRHQGRNEHGIDCVGLLIVVVEKFNLRVFYENNYRRSVDFTALIEPFYTHCRRKSISKKQPGDIILMRDAILPCHAAIVSDKTNIIHASAIRRKVIEEPMVGSLFEPTHCFQLKRLADG